MSILTSSSPTASVLAPFTAPMVIGLAFVAAILFDLVMPIDQARLILREDGPVESVSALVHLGAAVIALAMWFGRRSLYGLLALASVFMASREIDLHKAFTTHGVFSLKQYSSEAVPLAEKLISAGAVIALVVAFFLLTRGVWSEIRRLRARRHPALISLVTLLAALPVLKIIDGLPRMLRDQGVSPAAWLTDMLLAVEEIGEMALPFLTLVILWQLWTGGRRLDYDPPTLADARPRP